MRPGTDDLRLSAVAPPIGQRINVVGVTGSGKTTLARHIAACLHVPHIELDALHWDPNWQEASVEVFRSRVSETLSANAWTVDGNYSKTRDIVWGRADTVVWLDYSLPVILVRLFKRTLRRVVTREELWNGNREDWRHAVFSRESLFLWAIQTYPRHKREYPRLFEQPEYAHLAVVRLAGPRATARWLETLTSTPSSPQN